MPSYFNDGWGLTTNVCWPTTLDPYAEPGFALFRGDEYYVVDQQEYGSAFYTSSPIPAYVTFGKTRPLKHKRNITFDRRSNLFLEDTGNGTRPIRPEDLTADEELRLTVAQIAPKPSVPRSARNAKATSVDDQLSVPTERSKSPSRPSSRMSTATRTSSLPKVTTTFVEYEREK